MGTVNVVFVRLTSTRVVVGRGLKGREGGSPLKKKNTSNELP